MKQKVKYSTYSIVLSVILIAIVVALYLKRGLNFYVVCAILIIWCCAALFYMPLSVGVDDTALSVNRPLWFKKIKLSEISSIELSQPTMGERWICGSGGWMGYWGWFSQRDLGRYFAYYGKASDCFFVRLKNGRGYLIGCENPQLIVDFISSRICK